MKNFYKIFIVIGLFAAFSVTGFGQTYNFYFGNLHSQTWYSDGNQDKGSNVATLATSYPKPVAQAFTYAKTVGAANLNFFGVSDHNHNEGGLHMTLPFWRSGQAEADSMNQDGSFVCMYASEWGVISNGGHVLIYGTNKLFGWDAGVYDVYVPKSNYAVLFDSVHKYGGFCYLAHPQSSDYSGIFTGAYNALWDSVVQGCALKNGPAFSTNTGETDPSSTTYESRYHDLLRLGYHVAPSADQDNHNTNFGLSNQQRTVVLATSLTRANVLDALRNRRAYATEDHNLKLTFTSGTHQMGEIYTIGDSTRLSVSIADGDAGETTSNITIRYGVPGSGSAPTTLTSVSGSSTLNYALLQTNNSTYYYYVYVTQSNGLRAWSAPIWITKTSGGPPLAFNLTKPTNGATNQTLTDTLTWQSASGATGYTVALDTVNPPTTVVSTNQAPVSYIASGMVMGKTYYWKVTAINSFGNTVATGAPWSFSTVKPIYSASTSNISFGSVYVGTNKLDSVIVSNTGSATLRIDSVKSDNGVFTVSPGGTNIGAGGSQKYSVTFAPASTGLQSGTVRFYHNATGSPSSVSVSGTGAQIPLTATTHAGGTVTPSGTTNVNYGANQSYTISSTTGYHIDSVLVDGAKIGALTSYSFTNVQTAHTISAFFSLNTYSMASSSGAHGSISPNGTQTVNYGDSLNYTMTPAGGYSVSDVVVDGNSVGAVLTYKFTNISANHTIVSSFSNGDYTITATAGMNGSINPSGPVDVPPGSDTTFTITPSTGYQIDSLVVDGAYDGNGSSYQFTNVTANHTIKATFKVMKYTIAASSGANGSVTPSGGVIIDYGTDTTFTITPTTGYVTDSIFVDGSYIGTPATYKFTAVTANHTISAKFKALTFTIASSGGPNGTISPSGSIVVEYNVDTTFTITPNTGYHVDSVIVDGGYAGTGTSYTFNTVTANHSIRVVFKVNTYTISVVGSLHGTIAPPATITVNYGTDTTFTFTPDAGCHIDSLIVDGVNLSTAPSFAFTTITANHVLVVRFALNEYSLHVSVVGNGSVSRNPEQDTYTYGTNMQLTATAITGYAFAGWSGDTTALDNPLTVSITSLKNITATFVSTPLFYTAQSLVGFDSVLVGQAKIESVIVKNTGFAALALSSVSVSTSDYFVSPSSATIASGDSAIFSVTFQPTAEGIRKDSISFVHNAPGSPSTVVLNGTGSLLRLSVSVKPSWNLVSNPVTTTKDSVRQLYPSSFLPYAYSYGTNGYVQQPRLQNRTGYWEKFSSAAVSSIAGIPRYRDTIPVNSGWNLVGSISLPVPTSTIVPNGTNVTSQIYGYDRSYIATDSVIPGKAYWVKTDHAGSLVLSNVPGNHAPAKTVSVVSKFESMNSVIIQDVLGNGQTLYLGKADVIEHPEEYDLPPVPPAGIFDARFSSQRIAERYSPNAADNRYRVDISSAKYPLTVMVNELAGIHDEIIVSDMAGKMLATFKAGQTAGVKITNPNLTSLVLTIRSMPKEFALHQNYPNPFNPVSNIQFELPVDSRVLLRVYDILGREVQTLLNNVEQDAGFHQVLFDGTNIASGVYFYRIEASGSGDQKQSFTQVRRMILTK